ncbi:MAG TPA: glutamate-5-semialdehyde dehydrogenase [Chitinophaga sp.]|uniref:glutamate-5-semialdehyde dehydrogenase n=1 Tax=Chitinophaga sp. TaxID=1869181 RepID=UPI002D0BEB69|nr:glutamate-5-semialdehyde dehydrogenase [Chitinophaga sp.]HVI45844.1 glutamate-5-semialdehyde dehydrogenase [Chitinophaga sp.]
MQTILPMLERARQSMGSIRTLPDASKQLLLQQLAKSITEHIPEIIRENVKDLERMPDEDPKKDRLMLNALRLRSLAASLVDIARLPDPAGQLVLEKHLDNGLLVQKKTVPLGVVGVIYESRPNVTVDVAALCIRSGNACVLRGGSDAFHTNTYLVRLIQEALQQCGADIHAVQLLPADRALVIEMLSAVKYIDIIIPRGSQQLIEYVREHSRVPVIETGAGVCHTYVEKSANLEQAAAIVANAKISRPSVCNALDTVLVEHVVASDFISLVIPMLAEHAVEIYAEPLAHTILKEQGYPYLYEAQPEDFGREFLSLKCSFKVVPDTEAALAHIREHSSRHSEAIISRNPSVSEHFLNEVDAAAVYVNASTRFTDGGVFGLGAEIGISTQKLHARGPFALEKLVTEKWFIYGNGQIRE